MRPAQSRSAPRAEAASNLALGHGRSLVARRLARLALGVVTGLAIDAVLVAMFTRSSLRRAFPPRRLFERLGR